MITNELIYIMVFSNQQPNNQPFTQWYIQCSKFVRKWTCPDYLALVHCEMAWQSAKVDAWVRQKKNQNNGNQTNSIFLVNIKGIKIWFMTLTRLVMINICYNCQWQCQCTDSGFVRSSWSEAIAYIQQSIDYKVISYCTYSTECQLPRTLGTLDPRKISKCPYLYSVAHVTQP